MRFHYWCEALAITAFGLLTACSSSREQRSESAIQVTAKGSEPISIRTAAAEFTVFPSGAVTGRLLRGGQAVSLEGTAGDSGDYVVSQGKRLAFQLDLAHAKVGDARGKLGSKGRRVEITGRAAGGAAIERSVAIEVYDDFPAMALTTSAYRNTGAGDFVLDQAVVERHRLSASLADAKRKPFELWSFQGSAYDWGKDEILPLSAGFSRPNLVGSSTSSGYGGGIPIVDFWTASVGEAIGYLETVPFVASFPVAVGPDGSVEAAMSVEPHARLKSGESYALPRTFLAVHTGDYYEPLHTFSAALQREGIRFGKPAEGDYAANWCGWGYEENFTPAQMLGTIPKLRELGFKWTTLDYRWFDAYGDWNPRTDTFPGDSIKKVVDEFHRQGFRMQLWWQPIAIEDGHGTHALRKPMAIAALVKEHPEWLILDKDGRHAPLISPVSTTAALCPAVPEVQEFHRKLVEKFIRDWGYDGSKMDSIYSVPPCYNPKHHHKSPEDSVRAMPEIYRIIFETTRALKPDSVTQICPCGTTPNFALLPYEDQAVTADPVGGFQVRRRIKMYKALLGPEAAVYGDHVELSDMRQISGEWHESGRDFASTVGAGGVLGTKFTWPGTPPRPGFHEAALTPDKEAHWRKWISIYNAKKLSDGEFRNLYTIGYDVPEGYAIAKDGRMYYAFFAPAEWTGSLELRGLDPGTYRVFDYVNGKELGTVTAQNPRLNAAFNGSLLIEVSKAR